MPASSIIPHQKLFRCGNDTGMHSGIFMKRRNQDQKASFPFFSNSLRRRNRKDTEKFCFEIAIKKQSHAIARIFCKKLRQKKDSPPIFSKSRRVFSAKIIRPSQHYIVLGGYDIACTLHTQQHSDMGDPFAPPHQANQRIAL